MSSKDSFSGRYLISFSPCPVFNSISIYPWNRISFIIHLESEPSLFHLSYADFEIISTRTTPMQNYSVANSASRRLGRYPLLHKPFMNNIHAIKISLWCPHSWDESREASCAFIPKRRKYTINVNIRGASSSRQFHFTEHCILAVCWRSITIRLNGARGTGC